MPTLQKENVFIFIFTHCTLNNTLSVLIILIISLKKWKKKTKKKIQIFNYVAVARIRNICSQLVNVIMAIVNKQIFIHNYTILHAVAMETNLKLTTMACFPKALDWRDTMFSESIRLRGITVIGFYVYFLLLLLIRRALFL